MSSRILLAIGSWVALFAAGCQSPYYADRGALAGGLVGAGTGAIIGDALGNAGAGAAIGAGVGAISGGAIGQGLDEIEARNRAMIEAQLGGRQISSGACTVDDVIMMSQAGVDDQLIVNHVRANGVVAAPEAQDLVRLQEHGVSPRVVEAMQRPPESRRAEPVVYQQVAPPPVIVEEHHYGLPYWHRPRFHPYHRGYHPVRPGRFAWGVSVHGH
jgi:hypothetical protein